MELPTTVFLANRANSAMPRSIQLDESLFKLVKYALL